jgi:hypothetical protein
VEVSGVERWMPDHTRPYNQSRIRVGDFAASHVRQTLAAELDRLLCMPS